MSELRMEGMARVLDRLAKESTKVQTRVSRKAGNAGARVIANKARSNAPRRTGVLRRAIVGHISRKRTRPGNVVVALVRVRSGKKEAARVTKSGRSASRDAYYAGWVEFGHKVGRRDGERSGAVRFRRRAGGSFTFGRGADFVDPKPFLGPAYNTTQQQVLSAMVQAADEEMDKLP